MDDLLELMGNIDIGQKINIGDVLYIYNYDNYFYVLDINDGCDNVEYKMILLNCIINPIVIAKTDIPEFRKISFTYEGLKEVLSVVDDEIQSKIIEINCWEDIFNYYS